MQQAVIAAVRVAAAHEGLAELVVTLRHSNGGTSEVALDQVATDSLLKACQATHPEELNGQSWETVRDALSVSWNRYNPES
ncbi:MAG: hypothetical protein AAF529_04815 [Pseudomonadota bacterium]